MVSIGERKPERADHLLKSKLDHLVATAAPHSTTVAIVSSDNDFAPSLRLLKSSGFGTVLVHGGVGATAQLREYADHVLGWQEVRDEEAQQVQHGQEAERRGGGSDGLDSTEEEDRRSAVEPRQRRRRRRRRGRGCRQAEGGEQQQHRVTLLGPEVYCGQCEYWKRSFGFVRPDDDSVVRAALALVSTKRSGAGGGRGDGAGEAAGGGGGAQLAGHSSQRVYAHNTAIVCDGIRKLCVGERVEFQLGFDGKSRICAVAVHGEGGQPLRCEAVATDGRERLQ